MWFARTMCDVGHSGNAGLTHTSPGILFIKFIWKQMHCVLNAQCLAKQSCNTGIAINTAVDLQTLRQW